MAPCLAPCFAGVWAGGEAASVQPPAPGWARRDAGSWHARSAASERHTISHRSTPLKRTTESLTVVSVCFRLRRPFAMDPPYLGLLKGNYGISGMSWFKDYQKAFINTSRFRPIQHVMGFVLILGYCLEYPHLKHEQHARKKKAALAGDHH
eukprot:jgi/Chrpa1/3305/Chrysochromulina_OHIO_Genome00007684-RA